MTREDPLRRAVDLFNRRDFFAAHVVLEGVWRGAEGELRSFYEAMIRIATALHLRMHRGGRRGTVNLLQQALVRLDDLRPVCAAVDTAALYDDVAAYLERLRAAPGPASLLERFRLPRIRFAGGEPPARGEADRPRS
jgi:predicted metal-dependent hydrolase